MIHHNSLAYILHSTSETELRSTEGLALGDSCASEDCSSISAVLAMRKNSAYETFKVPYPWLKLSSSLVIEGGRKIPSLMIRNVSAVYTLFYCHDNKEDMCTSLPWLMDLATLCKVNIITFEYTGYGQLKDRPASRDQFYDDAYSVAICYIRQEHVQMSNLIL